MKSVTTPERADDARARHLGIAVTVIASAQLMVVLDATIMNIALPSLQADLDVSAANLAWVVNAYALAFGGLMLLGGRLGDLFGRRRVFRLGIVIFTVASLLGGLAGNELTLIAARVLQGVGAAIAAPTALSLIATTFPEGKPRDRAMGVYATMSGLGATVGLLLGGTLTDWLNWRWVMFVNIPIGLWVLAGTKVLAPGEPSGQRGLDLPGALTGTGGMVSLVYAITQGGERGWGDSRTVAFFVAAAVLLAAFLVIQTRSSQPMMPLRLFKDRNRAGSYVTFLFIGSGLFAMFYFLTLYMQLILQYSPVKTGLAYLPFSFGMAAAAGLGSKLVATYAPRLLAGPGILLSAAGLLYLTTLEPDSSYVGRLLPAMVVISVGLGLCFVPLTLAGVSGTTNEDAGIASALVNTAQQLGGALGLAVLATVSTTAANDRVPAADQALFRGLATHDFDLVRRAADALTHGYTAAFLLGALLFAGALLITVFAINAKGGGAGG